LVVGALFAASYQVFIALPQKREQQAQEAADKKLLKRQVYYADEMGFLTNMKDSSFLPVRAYYSGTYKKCVFVDSKDQATGYSKDTVVMWPTVFTGKALYAINFFVELTEVDLAKYSLTYPVTMKDAVDRWADVRKLIAGCQDNGFTFDIADPSMFMSKDGEWSVIEKVLYFQRIRCQGNAESTDIPGVILTAYQPDKYKDCVIVSSKDKAVGYEPDVIVVWPTESTKTILEALNKDISEKGIDLKPYSLSYPVTMGDVVDKWENVANLMTKVDPLALYDPRL
jgi:hypothetical protein